MKENTINLLVADDHKMFRDGARAMLNNEPSIKVVAEAGNGNEVLAMIKNKPTDLVLMDIQMPDLDGILATKELVEKYPKTKVLVISMCDEENDILEVIQAGANGYILKNTGRDELIEAIKAVSVGDTYFSKEISNKMVTLLKTSDIKKHSTSPGDEIPLTDREIEVLKLIAKGHTNQDIASELFISKHTAITHRRNLLQKLNLKNTAALVRYAATHELLD